MLKADVKRFKKRDVKRFLKRDVKEFIMVLLNARSLIDEKSKKKVVKPFSSDELAKPQKSREKNYLRKFPLF